MLLTATPRGGTQPAAARRGFTLVELLVALVIMSMVGVVVVRLMTGAQRLTTTQAARAALQGNTRGGALLLPAELREIDPAGGDIISATLSATSLQYRATRGFGVVCSYSAGSIATGGTGTVKLYNITNAAQNTAMRFNAARSPVAGDQLLVLADTAPTNTADDRWAVFNVSAAPASSTCPDGSAALSFTVSLAVTVPVQLDPSATILAAGPAGVPARLAEPMELSLYTDAAGQKWLGARANPAGGGAIQPVLGPLDGTEGLRFRYFKGDGTTATVPTDVRAIEAMIRGVSDRKVKTGLTGGTSVPADSQTVVINLRNAP